MRMNRKQIKRALEKHDKGLRKKLDKTDFDNWENVLNEHSEQILIISKSEKSIKSE